jgi:hypothetical protein
MNMLTTQGFISVGGTDMPTAGVTKSFVRLQTPNRCWRVMSEFVSMANFFFKVCRLLVQFIKNFACDLVIMLWCHINRNLKSSLLNFYISVVVELYDIRLAKIIMSYNQHIITYNEWLLTLHLITLQYDQNNIRYIFINRSSLRLSHQIY